jgi:maltose alpha-D-glucosyltransferase/alpha-amylase
VLLDFEGEPSKSLAERRRKQSPLRDVAGMMRSFSYAAFAGLNQYKEAHPEAAAEKGQRLEEWARAWGNSAAGAFLGTYRETISAKHDLLPPIQEAQKLLNAYVLEKALYELLYELNNRPTWLRIPIAGILTL